MAQSPTPDDPHNASPSDFHPLVETSLAIVPLSEPPTSPTIVPLSEPPVSDSGHSPSSSSTRPLLSQHRNSLDLQRTVSTAGRGSFWCVFMHQKCIDAAISKFSLSIRSCRLRQKVVSVSSVSALPTNSPTRFCRLNICASTPRYPEMRRTAQRRPRLSYLPATTPIRTTRMLAELYVGRGDLSFIDSGAHRCNVSVISVIEQVCWVTLFAGLSPAPVLAASA